MRQCDDDDEMRQCDDDDWLIMMMVSYV
jgi:hypothetical protein